MRLSELITVPFKEDESKHNSARSQTALLSEPDTLDNDDKHKSFKYGCVACIVLSLITIMITLILINPFSSSSDSSEAFDGQYDRYLIVISLDGFRRFL